MAKLPVFSLRRPDSPAHTRTFTDPEQPGQELVLTLKRIGAFEASLAQDAAQEFLRETGGGIAHEGGLIVLTDDMAKTLCMIETMQAGPVEERYTAPELAVLLQVFPNAVPEILAWVGQVQESKVGREPGKNGSRADSGA